MDEAVGVLAQLGPAGVLAAGFVALTAWVARIASGHAAWRTSVSHRLDDIDHRERGRVTKVERRVDDLEDAVADIKTDVALAANNSTWIKDTMERALRSKGPAQ